MRLGRLRAPCRFAVGLLRVTDPCQSYIFHNYGMSICENLFTVISGLISGLYVPVVDFVHKEPVETGHEPYFGAG